MRTFSILALLMTAFLSSSAPATENPAAPCSVTYVVSDQAVTVVSAVTPFDADPQTRNAFLHWFKRGFDTILAGLPPLMIEWDTTPKAKAGRSGYDFGMDEAERYLKKKKPERTPLTVPIPPGER